MADLNDDKLYRAIRLGVADAFVELISGAYPFTQEQILNAIQKGVEDAAPSMQERPGPLRTDKDACCWEKPQAD